MQLLHILSLTLLISHVCGDGLCSRNQSKIKCEPCSSICENGEMCEFRCPKQCRTSELNMCNDVCPWQCRDSKCEYEINGRLKCSEGCRDGLAGKNCREKCSTGCKRCQQFNRQCISCDENVDGKNCSEKDDNTDATIYADEQSTHRDEQPTHRDEQPTYRDEQSLHRTSEDNETAPSVFSETGLIIFIVGTLAAVIITVIVMIASYKLRKWRKRTKMRLRRNERVIGGVLEHTVRKSDGYAYIEDVHSDRYFSSLERPKMQSVKIGDLTENTNAQYHHISVQQT